MTVSTVDTIMIRIKAATLTSPIAVFRVPLSEPGMLNAVFGQTTETIRNIKEDAENYVGIFNRHMDIEKVMKLLDEAARTSEKAA